ncbi:hypothetical protein [Bythopirellula goksoeyrii]|uniref:Uncharacterized protein n=1 Tax=Bythopirellula goksoeyrii TaxID=1400387 RepID=A0A5B9QGF4_9BACT|nr:hypothetical protein [Bythopirellula goksoeyrii]QEG36006.1 hypothetical protein Pr1d_33150 [Bythopirellula goksoeyrii]
MSLKPSYPPRLFWRNSLGGAGVNVMIRPRFVWLILFVCSGVALWQLTTPEPSIPALAVGLGLLLAGGILGLRWGSDSADQLIKEMAQLNKYLAEQNQELAELNHMHVKRLLEEEESPREKAEFDA